MVPPYKVRAIIAWTTLTISLSGRNYFDFLNAISCPKSAASSWATYEHRTYPER